MPLKVYNNVTKNYDQICQSEFSLNQTLTAPIYVFYGLTNFYTNHMEFAKSRVWTQLRGEGATVNQFN